MAEALACSAAKLAAYMDPNIPWSALAAQMDVAPWQALPPGLVPPTQAATASGLGFQHATAATPQHHLDEQQSQDASGSGQRLVKIFIAAGSAHGLVHIWQALGWGNAMWQRVAIKGQVMLLPHHRCLSEVSLNGTMLRGL